MSDFLGCSLGYRDGGLGVDGLVVDPEGNRGVRSGGHGRQTFLLASSEPTKSIQSLDQAGSDYQKPDTFWDVSVFQRSGV